MVEKAIFLIIFVFTLKFSIRNLFHKLQYLHSAKILSAIEFLPRIIKTMNWRGFAMWQNSKTEH